MMESDGCERNGSVRPLRELNGAMWPFRNKYHDSVRTWVTEMIQCNVGMLDDSVRSCLRYRVRYDLEKNESRSVRSFELSGSVRPWEENEPWFGMT